MEIEENWEDKKETFEGKKLSLFYYYKIGEMDDRKDLFVFIFDSILIFKQLFLYQNRRFFESDKKQLNHFTCDKRFDPSSNHFANRHF